MNLLDTISDAIAQQHKKQHRIFIAATAAIIAAMLGGIVYFLYAERESNIQLINELKEQSKKNDALMAKSERIKAEEERVQTLLEINKGFNIKTFFETLTSNQKLKAEPGWDTERRDIDGNETFDEIVLAATFKGQTTQSLVSLLGTLENNEIVYIKELEIKKDGKKTISFELTIATKKRKQFWED
ncbi:MAG: hypothetical protein QG632_591 [Candidatus Dependentiae bacterium]|nr:hypothetical protein [Candidatus Dependentiae bacterium]